MFCSYVCVSQGHRLGTASEQQQYRDNPAAATTRQDDSLPAPVYDKNLSEEERAKVRADRAAAAEARLKKQVGKTKKKKKEGASNAPLTGPNTEPLMRWH